MSTPRLPALLLLSLTVGCGGFNAGKPVDSGEVDADGDGSPAGEDCDDDNAAVYPGAPEVCDGVDNDCNAAVDEADAGLTDGATWYPDADGDGYGSETGGEVACEQPSGAVAEGGDCDDADELVNPGGTEDCSTAADDDCSGSPNDVDAVGCTLWYVDADEDSHGALDAASACLCFPEEEFQSPTADDCDDANPDVSPSEAEVCNDELDNNCDGGWDECRHSRMGPVSERGIELYAQTEDGETGEWLDAGGDITGDGVTDLVVSAPGEGSAGKVFVVASAPSSGTTLTNAADLEVDADVASQMMAGIIVPDATGDGLPDLISFGTTPYDNYAEISVFAGPLSGDVDPGDAAARHDLGMEALTSLSDMAAVDWDGDGEDEAVFLFGIDGQQLEVDDVAGAGSVTEGSTIYDQVERIADINGDGMDELLYGSVDGGAGQAVLWLNDGSGAPSATASSGTVFYQQDEDDLLGASMASAGDVNGDGYGDWLIGAPYHETDEYRQGVVYVFHGAAAPTADNLNDADFELIGKLRNDHAGMGAVGLGDMDGDGHADIAVASTGWDTASYNNAGTVYFAYGPFAGTVGLTDVRGRVEGGHSNGLLGSHMVGNVDLNADGYMDLIMAEATNDTGANDAGAVWLMYGEGL
jgi:hypothetical protein